MVQQRYAARRAPLHDAPHSLLDCSGYARRRCDVLRQPVQSPAIAVHVRHACEQVGSGHAHGRVTHRARFGRDWGRCDRRAVRQRRGVCRVTSMMVSRQCAFRDSRPPTECQSAPRRCRSGRPWFTVSVAMRDGQLGRRSSALAGHPSHLASDVDVARRWWRSLERLVQAGSEPCPLASAVRPIDCAAWSTRLGGASTRLDHPVNTARPSSQYGSTIRSTQVGGAAIRLDHPVNTARRIGDTPRWIGNRARRIGITLRSAIVFGSIRSLSSDRVVSAPVW
jgi:hypothetical protein